MPVVRVDALCECDICGKRFGVELETGYDITAEDDLTAVVYETVQSGQFTSFTWGVRGKQTIDRFPLSYQPTLQGGYLLCDVCSKKCDDLPIEGNLTMEQVEECLQPEKEQF